MKSLSRLTIAVLTLCPMLSLGETRANSKSPQQLTNESTLVVEGVVSGVDTVQEYKVSFPIKAEVTKVLKGTWNSNTIEFIHRSPGKWVIFQEEYNSPAIGQVGTFFLLDEDGKFVLIGYINKKTEPTSAGDVLKAAPEK